MLTVMANLREKQKANTRRQLLQESLRLFEEKGYAATTVDDIATAVGTTRVTFYAHFANKAEVIRALFDDLNEILERGPSEQHRSTAAPLVEAVRVGTFAAIHEWLVVQIARWPQIRGHITVVFQAAAVDAEIRQLTDDWYDEVIGDMCEGMALADRHSPETRPFRGYLAQEALTTTNLKWNRQPWPLEDAKEFEILAGVWTHLLGDESA